MVLISQYYFGDLSELELVEDVESAKRLVEKYAQSLGETRCGFSLVEFKEGIPVSAMYYSQGRANRWEWTVADKEIVECSELEGWKKWREIVG